MTPDTVTSALKRTRLYNNHVAAGAKMVEFGGWEMPVQYAGIIQEHTAVRQAAGLFDVSHMGEFRVGGPGAAPFVQHVVANDVSKIAAGKALYTQFTRPDGGTVDDLLVYAEPDGGYLLVVNAGNIAKDWDWLQSHKPQDVTLVDESDATAMLAIQGPRAREIVAGIFSGPEPLALKSFHWAEGKIAEIPVRIARTGYTGEDGFEIFCPAEQGPGLWDALMAAGKPMGLEPVGLGARDTLRLEAGLPLYGHELTDEIGPVQAGYGWSVKIDKGEFLGREVLARHKQGELVRKVVGLRLGGRQIARQGYAVFAGDRQVGEVLSGTFSPTLQAPIATALVEVSALNAPLFIQVRAQQVPANIVPLPFYRRQQ
jgi:aminomethyltransferase